MFEIPESLNKGTITDNHGQTLIFWLSLQLLSCWKSPEIVREKAG